MGTGFNVQLISIPGYGGERRVTRLEKPISMNFFNTSVMVSKPREFFLWGHAINCKKYIDNPAKLCIISVNGR